MKFDGENQKSVYAKHLYNSTNFTQDTLLLKINAKLGFTEYVEVSNFYGI